MRIAVVTGASSGMGRDAARMIDAGYDLDEIWLIARREERLLKLCAELKHKCRVIEADLLKKESLDKIEHKLDEIKPEIKIFVNSAGFGKIGDFEKLTADDNTDMVMLNCLSLTRLTHAALRFMNRGGRIIQFASSAAFAPQPRFAVYAATKAYVYSFSRALGHELRKRGISVTAVCPGPVKTEFFDLAEQTGKIPFYKRLVMADSKKVTAKALRDSEKGKSVSVYGAGMKLLHLCMKLLPVSLILKFF